MSNFAGIFNAEEWVSDHYFSAEKGTCFAAAQRQVVRGWKDDEKDGHSTPISRFSTARSELLTLLLQGEEQPEQTSVQVSAILRRILGYGGEPEAIRLRVVRRTTGSREMRMGRIKKWCG